MNDHHETRILMEKDYRRQKRAGRVILCSHATAAKGSTKRAVSKFLIEPSRRVPIVREVDVLVVGGAWWAYVRPLWLEQWA